jgi:hypothetical protein
VGALDRELACGQKATHELDQAWPQTRQLHHGAVNLAEGLWIEPEWLWTVSDFCQS